MGNTITSNITLPAIRFSSESAGSITCTASNGVSNVSDSQVLYLGGELDNLVWIKIL